MKKMISLLLALALALTLCACVTPKTPMPIEDGDKSAAQPVTVRLGGLKGPTSMGMVKLLTMRTTAWARTRIRTPSRPAPMS